MKPRIRKATHGWICESDRCTAWGFNPEGAYQMWQQSLPQIVAGTSNPTKKARRVERLPPSSHFSVEQAMAYAQQTVDAGNLQDVMVIGWQPGGEIYSISSHMSREWALWLLNELIDRTRGVGRYAGEY